jgi:hypothetical protein
VFLDKTQSDARREVRTGTAKLKIESADSDQILKTGGDDGKEESSFSSWSSVQQNGPPFQSPI